MKRLLMGLAACSIVLAQGVVLAQSPEEQRQTAALIAAAQNPDGGFGAEAGQTSSLPTTSSAIRILKHTGGSIPDVLGCIRYLKSCYDPASGGFAQTPGGKPDVPTTAVGMIACAELKIPTDEFAAKAIEYLSKNAEGFEQIRIAVAGLEGVKKTASDFPKWQAAVEATRNSDGTWGKALEQPRDTGGAAVALLRMGVKLDKREAVVAALKAGQRPDGGWGRGDNGSDLEATYRIMRCFYMLNEKPDLDKVTRFIARCRQSDGSYSVKPGTPSTLSGTYYATIVLRWSKLLNGELPVVETAGFVPLTNGRDLAGWQGDQALWSTREGMIVGTSPGLKHNDFLATEKSYGDFLLKLSFRLIGDDTSNSGVQFRSVRVPGHEMSGYQADIGQNYWGCLYDESRRNKILEPGKPEAIKALRKADWNQYEIRAQGGHITLKLNGVTSVDYQEPDSDIARSGRIALQIHAGGPLEVQFKDILIQEFPTPVAGDDTKPGFHLRNLKTSDGVKKYSVFVPSGYNGEKPFPVALFLHGSGARGDDGVQGAQSGLGAAIAGHPDDYPFIAVFPQAKTTWKAGSDDIKNALAALDDVLSTYKVDTRRVMLTGLSMGGSGTWELAAAHPDRFSVAVPICGRGDARAAQALKALPVGSVVGDDDSDATVQSGRAMVEAIKAAGGDARETEYRGVGHNSWDRAYTDPALIKWMLSKTRAK